MSDSSETVVLPGFEPGQAEPKTAVLPLHHKTILNAPEPRHNPAGISAHSQSQCKVTIFFRHIQTHFPDYTRLTHLNFLQNQNFLRHKVDSRCPSGSLPMAFYPHRGYLCVLDYIQSNAVKQRKILSGIILLFTRGIIAESDIQCPVQLILNAPVCPYRMINILSVSFKARQVISGLLMDLP